MSAVAKQRPVRLQTLKVKSPHNPELISALEFQKLLFEVQRKLPFYYKVKIVLETIAAASLLLLLSPLMLSIAVVISWRIGCPVFYKQLRVGVNGKLFWAYKFRTMRNNCPKVVDLGFRPLEKVSEDPRVEGRLGRFLRKWKWDELPQLWNVIRGDMLLIGPRPYLYEENFHFNKKFFSRFAIRPGLSGLWQAHGAHINDPRFKARLDCYYIKKLSLSTDVWIWFRTLYILSIGEKL